MTFARTKIQPPRRRAGLIPRPALDAQLAEVLATRRLVVLCAPAGFGKTAVLTRQIERLSDGPAPAWVSIDEDDDLQRLLECLFAALEPFDLPWRIAPEALGASVGHTRSERRAVADELLNMLAATDIPRGLIVLDDLHRAEDPAVFEFLDLLIERLPDHWGLVVASRFDPPLALGRLRAAGEMAEFRMADLRFDAHEVLQLGELLSPGHTRPVSEGDVELLLARTGGWAAGLRLALASVVARRPPLKSGPSEGIEWASSGRTMDRHVFDYLASEVLGQMPVELRDFLLRCSVLSELTPERCAAVSGDRHAAERLAEIERRELFVSVLEGTERTLRLHDLFRDFLDDRLRQEHPDEVPMLLERAAAGETDPLRRTTYLLRAHAWDAAAEVLAAEGLKLLTAGAIEPVLRIIEQFPPAVREASHTVQCMRGLAGWAQWDWAAMTQAMQRALGVAKTPVQSQAARAYLVIALTAGGQRATARTLLQELQVESLERDTLLIALLGQTWAAFDEDRFEDLPPLFEHQLDLLEQTDAIELWYQCVPIAPYVGLPGMRPLLQRFATGAIARSRLTTTTLRAIAQGLQGGLLMTVGRLDEALEVLLDAERDLRWLGRPLNASSMIHSHLAFTQCLRGEGDAALGWCEMQLEQNRRLNDEVSVVRIAFVAFCAGRIGLALGDDYKAREWFDLATEGTTRAERPSLARHRAALPGYRALVEGRIDEAIAHFERLIDNGDLVDIFGHASELQLRLVQCLMQRGRREEAARRLAPVIARHRDDREIAPILLAGTRTLSELADADWGKWLAPADVTLLQRWAGLARAYLAAGATPLGVSRTTAMARGVETLVTTGADIRPHVPVGGAARAAADASPLSQRELEVLKHIAAGDSNKLIARALDLSPHTVKRHVANILDKLGLASRGQAAAWFVQQPGGV